MRTNHAIDVLVDIEVAGIAVRWVIERKHWKEPVSKLHVLALREIVADLGADRGIILCEVGFQSGAIEAATLTNVQVSSLAQLSITSKEAMASARLREISERVELCRDRYWEIPKDVRIDNGLRIGLNNRDHFSGARAVEFAEKYLNKAFREVFPINVDPFDIKMLARTFPEQLLSNEEVVVAFDTIITELEQTLDRAEGKRVAP